MSARLALVGLRPDVLAVRRAHQLHTDAQHVAALAHAAQQHVGHAELGGDRAHVFVLALERECRRARDDPQVAAARQAIDQFLRQAVGEILLVALLAQVGERQHGDRLVLGRRRQRRRRDGHCRGRRAGRRAWVRMGLEQRIAQASDQGRDGRPCATPTRFLARYLRVRYSGESGTACTGSPERYRRRSAPSAPRCRSCPPGVERVPSA